MTGAIIRVMLVDDHAIVRSGFRRLLEQHPEIQVVAEAGDSEQAYRDYLHHLPQVLVLDLSMPGIGGFEIMRRVLAREPTARVIVFSMHDEAALAERALQLGARGYVSKSNAPEVLAQAVIEVAAGRQFVSRDIAQAVSAYKRAGDPDPFKQLSAREIEIFRQLVAGSTAAEIAESLSLSVKTIANYHTAIKQKLAATNDVELMRVALRFNILSHHRLGS